MPRSFVYPNTIYYETYDFRLLDVNCRLHFFAKRIERDPSYSVRNYKHADKVAIARTQRLDNLVFLQPAMVRGSSEYKHPYNQSGLVVRATIKTNKSGYSGRGHKHPLGL